MLATRLGRERRRKGSGADLGVLELLRLVLVLDPRLLPLENELDNVEGEDAGVTEQVVLARQSERSKGITNVVTVGPAVNLERLATI